MIFQFPPLSGSVHMERNTLTGTVQSGAAGFTPLAGVPVTLYRATADDPVTIGQAVTDEDGAFSIAVPEGEADTIYYATARYRPGVLLVAVVGPRVTRDITINEMSTVAAAYSMAQFSDGTRIAGNAFGLRIAAGMNDNLVAPGIGTASLVLLTPPNAGQTIGWQTINSLANLLLRSVRRGGDFEQELFDLTTIPGGARPADTFQAVQNIAHNPDHNVQALYDLSWNAEHYFEPVLDSPPAAWTLAVKFNHTGDDETPFGGPANIAFDRNGYAWVANNVIQGTPRSGHFIVVLRPDGHPARGGDGKPASPVYGGGLNGPGWGITIDPTDHVWVGNFGWGVDEQDPHEGSVSEFLLDGTPESPDGWHQGTDRVQATVSDKHCNIWMASYGNGRVVVFVGGEHTHALFGDSGNEPFGVAVDSKGNVWVTNGGGLGWPVPEQGTVTRFRLDGPDTLVQTLAPQPVGVATKVIVTDSKDQVWVASSGDGFVYRVGDDGSVLGQYDGGGIDGPWGLAVDGDDNLWVANFGRMGMTSAFAGRLSKLKGANKDARPEGVPTGTALTPDSGYTLRTGGAPVTLPGGDVLYSDGMPCYTPFMRATSCQIDQAGNVWVVNNWKPGFASDFDPQAGDPGGDGIVVFVGLAPPPPNPWA
jgi:streptogramin lyase